MSAERSDKAFAWAPCAAAVFASSLIAGCAQTPARTAEIQAITDAAREIALDCPPSRTDRCAPDTPLAEIDTADNAAHHVILLDSGSDALSARLHMIRTAREHIIVQSYLIYPDQAGRLILAELVSAARRGVRVRILVDALFSLPQPEIVARLASAHTNLELRLYNPVFDRVDATPARVSAALLCCFRRINHRMHNKLLAVDGRYAILGGRNFAERYFDLDPESLFRDAEILVAGSAVAGMEAGFELFWSHSLSRKPEALADVGRHLIDHGAPETDIVATDSRLETFIRAAEDPAWIETLLSNHAFKAQQVSYFSDPPLKPFLPRATRAVDSTGIIHDAIAAARESVIVQTPYFIMSPRFKQVLDGLPEQVEIVVSTNSLASTNAWPAYAMTRRQLQAATGRLGIRIFEFKPYPRDRALFVPRYAELIEKRAAGMVSAQPSVRSATRDMPEPRLAVHGKLAVIDGHTTIITTHNFDPRSEFYNSENGLVIHDPAFAAAMRARIERDIAPVNSWTVAPRPPGAPVLGPINRALAGLSRRLPTLDLWPARATSNYRLPVGAEPLPFDHPEFHDIYEMVGEFPDIVRRSRVAQVSLISRFLGFARPLL